jgi:ceramide glucosyltransferase
MHIFISVKQYGSHKKSHSSQLDATSAPPVTVLRPLKGVDPNLMENLESTFTQDYPVFELLFMVAEDTDPSVNVVNELCKKYPHIDAKLLIGN